MKVSRNWLQKYVSKEIPKGEDFVNLLAMNIFEVENREEVANGDEVFDVKVLPDRNAYCLSHRGIAREIAILIDSEFKIPEILSTPVSVSANLYAPKIEIVKNDVCRKYLAREIKNIEVTESNIT
jgi:phenylalanyl-tRNA synthetase beta subunit